MEFKISISENGKYLIVDVFQAITGELEKNFLKESIEVIKAHNIKNIFVDVSTVQNIARITDNYKFAYDETKRLGHPRDVKIAVFVNPEDHSHDFMETLFKNAGYNCNIFQDKSSAIEWLNK